MRNPILPHSLPTENYSTRDFSTALNNCNPGRLVHRIKLRKRGADRKTHVSIPALGSRYKTARYGAMCDQQLI